MFIDSNGLPTLYLKPEVDLDTLPGFKWKYREKDKGFVYINGPVRIGSNTRLIECDKLDKKALEIILWLCCEGFVKIIFKK